MKVFAGVFYVQRVALYTMRDEICFSLHMMIVGVHSKYSDTSYLCRIMKWWTCPVSME